MQSELIRKINKICDNINEKGLYRYDPRDISDYCNKIEGERKRRITSIILQLVEAINPYFIRKIIQSKKRLYPTTYTFLAESQIIMEDKLSISTAYNLMNECIRMYYVNTGGWKYYKNTSFFAVPSNKKPSMPLYMLCRCNNIILRLSSIYKDDNYYNISDKSAKYMLKNHIITEYGTNKESISYYYNSDECTINVNTEILEWFVRLIEIEENEILKTHVKRILRMVIDEQNDNGSWFYFSKKTMKKYHLRPSIDCHHSATVLYNLIHVYVECTFLENELRKKLCSSVERGMKYFVNNFFDYKGNGITIIGKKRKASTMQYAESVIAIGEYLRFFDKNNSTQYRLLLDNIIKNIMSLVENDGSAPGDYKIKRINIDNINWGNGAALYALCYYNKFFGD